MTRKCIGVFALAFGLAGCASRPELAPVIASQTDLAALSGEWDGRYETNEDGGRSGFVYFDLTSGRDSASGFVTMTFSMPRDMQPRKYGIYPAPMASDELTITFVQARDGFVNGELAPYSDPYCGCRLITTFSGRLSGEEIRGTYTTRHADTGHIVQGKWWASRQRGH